MFELLDYAFFRNALWAVAILSITSALVGTYIVTRRLVAISGGVTHACFGGLGLGYFLGVNPILTATLFAIGSSVGVELMSARSRVREDSAIAVVWAVGMAVGVIFVFLTPGYVPELNSFLFGNILTVSRGDLLLFVVFTLILLIFFISCYKLIVICAFDKDFATVAGLPVKAVNYAMTIFVAIAIVLTIRLVGMMLLMSMFTLPQLTAEIYCRRFKTIMWASLIVSLLTGIAGLLLATVIDVPCSALIVAIMAITYLLARICEGVARRHHCTVQE